ncbi:VENN motif pre-toxin domain-containing protein [Pantoea sp.]|uniref:VENN motif pre-toxin domain-containing protein n=1 Tax=Pantoea sp. TaxID=69393 RepID=UPI0028B0354B|nr:VENN motif pre-toxin domain-containing protein [Pantoea sp.]
MANGTLIVRDQNRQTQDVSALSRDTEHANDSISAIFDKEKEQERLQTAQLAGEISGQMTNIVTTMGDIKGLEKAQSAKNAETLPAGATEKQRGEWLEKMRDSPEYQAEMKQWGIGSTSQKVAQTVGSILTGLVTGNAAQAVAGGLNPWAAQLIKKETTDASGNVDVATNAMTHAVWGAVSSQMSGGSAAAGAAGAFSGELATRYIAEKYWGADTPEKIAALGQEDREQLSLLGTLAAGLAGGMAGNSSAAATSGAVAGKNALENNLLGGGTEEGQAAWIRQHGIDMATCESAPGSASCQKAMNERDAVGLALATGSVALLPGGAQAMWGLGASANAGISYLADGTIDPANVAIGGWVNVISMGNGLAGTVGWNATGGALGNWLDDKDVLSGALINGIGSGIGYGIGKGLSWGVNAGANWWKGGWDPKFNPTLQKYTEIKSDYGISKEVTPSNIPGSLGDIGASFSSEYGGKKLEPIIEDKLK